MNNSGKILFTVGLIALMLFKVSAFHVYEHHEEDADHQECHLCDQAMDNQLAELHLQTEINSEPAPSETIEVVKTMGNPISVIAHNKESCFFLRPPPKMA